jgi:hypothetical protein
MQTTISHRITLMLFLILSLHLRPGLPSGLFQGSVLKLRTFNVRATCLFHLIFLMIIHSHTFRFVMRIGLEF